MEKVNQADIVLIDLFSGVGGFHKALEEAGFNITHCYFSEIDKYAISVYKYHFKEAIYVGSVVDVSGTEIRRRHPNARIVVCFGWPCQDNSIAGKRKGHSGGKRSSLLYEAVRIIQEARPFCFFAENVKGLYSVNAGVDFVESLRLLSFLNCDSPQYIVEQQLLNTAWLLPQNRERTYFVGYPAKRGFREVLPIGASITASVQEEATRDLRERISTGQDGIPGRHQQTSEDANSDGSEQESALCLRWQNKQAGIVEDDKVPSLRASGGTDIRKRPLIQEAVVNKNGDLESMQLSNCIDSSYHKGMDNHGQRTMVSVVNGVQSQSDRVYDAKGLAPTLRSGSKNTGGVAPIILCDSGQGRKLQERDTVAPLRSNTGAGHGNYVIQQRGRGKNKGGEHDISPSVTSNSFEHNNHVVGQRIRRLTEIETNRLQGFPDGWCEFGVKVYGLFKKSQAIEVTAFGDIGIPISSTQQYKQMGNAISIPVAKAVALAAKSKLF